MPVDDNAILDMLQSANDELNVISSKKASLRKFIQGCKEITKVPKKDDPKIMEIRNDRLLGIPLTPVRRQAIYDKLLDDKVKLGL